MKKLMLGNEAIARGAYEAGVKVSAAYPGTPSTEISENIVKYPEIYCEWSPNEKVAAEVAIGASMAGARSMACMKHVGLNVASDPLYTVGYIGVNGGLVFCVADDPGLYSSQNEQDTRNHARASCVALLEPSDSQEAKDFTKFAFEMSEKYDVPVILRSTTRLAHSQGLVELCDRVETPIKPYEKNIAKNVMMPANAKKRHVIVEQNLNRLAEDACGFDINKMEILSSEIGFITSGIAYQYVKEAMPEASVLKLGIINPLPMGLIKEFSKKVKKLVIFEELFPFIEEQVKAQGIECVGKELFTIQGEYSANMLKKAFNKPVNAKNGDATIPMRPPILCPGCPHRSTFSVLKKMKIHASGDIGCYTLGAVQPLGVIDSALCMGGSISMLHGIEKARGSEFVKDWVACIGDSTFLHTGINSLMNMVYNKATGVVMILDNSITAMTGHQDHAATGKTLMGEETHAINIAKLCEAIGVKRVNEISAFDTLGLENLLKQELSANELSVIVVKAPCVLLKGITFKDKCKEVTEKCKKCGRCLSIGCPALTKNDDGTIKIDQSMCNGCGLCTNYCAFDAIKLIKGV